MIFIIPLVIVIVLLYIFRLRINMGIGLAVSGIVLLELFLRVVGGGGIFDLLFDDELAGIIIPILLIGFLIVFVFVRNKNQTDLSSSLKVTAKQTLIIIGVVALFFFYI